MEKSETRKIIYYINSCYPKSNLKPDDITLEAWTEMLGSYSYDDVKKSVKKLIRELKFVPTINEIIENIEESYTLENDKTHGGVIITVVAHEEKMSFRFVSRSDFESFKNFIDGNPSLNQIRQYHKERREMKYERTAKGTA